jgi:cyanophycinase-like exopeptidase
MARHGRIVDDGRVPLPRVLVILGSGETSPTMVTPHQQVFAQLGADGAAVNAVCLDTPYGFQENADELTERVCGFFAASVGRVVQPVRFRSRAEADADPASHAEQMAALAAARWVFAGPGSPSYALRQWTGSLVPAALDSRLATGGEGGAVVFASAAALTLGLVTVPVYEVYKVGEEPRWLDGLDVLGRATGLRAAVVPHFDNTEGGTHDTRFCYLGERRLAVLEAQLPPDCFVLGVDEHTGLVLDLDAGSGHVIGRGNVTVRAGGGSSTYPSGSALAIAELAERAGQSGPTDAAPSAAAHDAGLRPPASLADVDAALAAGQVKAAVVALLALESSAGSDADREAVRAGVARLGAYAADAPVDRAAEVGPYVDLLLELRAAARTDRRFADADAVRDRLEALGIEVRDTPDGATWGLRELPGRRP